MILVGYSIDLDLLIFRAFGGGDYAMFVCFEWFVVIARVLTSWGFIFATLEDTKHNYYAQ